jgi:ATP-dependent Clp protease, protease subunit
MSVKNPSKKMVLPRLIQDTLFAPTITSARTLRYNGAVTRALSDKTLKDIERLMHKAPGEDVFLMVTSTGGPTGIAMNFFDTIRHILRAPLVTIGSGDVDSSGVIIFLTGERRYVTARTTLLLHSAGRFFGAQRYTTTEMASMLREDRLKDEQYAGVIAERSQGALSITRVLELMERQVVLTPQELVDYNLAHGILA